jgi:hypothetical protein
MKERPILMSAPMVRALLEGRKTQTRRVLKPHPEWVKDGVMFWKNKAAMIHMHACPYGQLGDRLWVRETGWERPERTPKMMREGADTWEAYYYDADGWSAQDHADFKAWGFKRRPSIHMPRWASRILLELTDIRVERLQDISEEDAKAEGVSFGNITDQATGEIDCDAIEAYETLWESINGPGSWDKNPWVWVISFKKVSHEE